MLCVVVFAEELSCDEVHFSSGRPYPTSSHVTHGPPTAKSGPGGPDPPQANKSLYQPRQQTTTVVGWSSDDERIFDREAAKINLKWSKRAKKKNSEEGENQEKRPKSSHGKIKIV